MLFCHLSGMFLNYLWDSYQHRPLLGKYSIEANSNQLKIKKQILSDKVKLVPRRYWLLHGPWMGCMFSINVCTAGLLLLPGGKPNIGRMHKSSCRPAPFIWLTTVLREGGRCYKWTIARPHIYLGWLQLFVHFNLFWDQKQILIGALPAAWLKRKYIQLTSIFSPAGIGTNTAWNPDISNEITRFAAHCNDFFKTR